MFLMLMVWSRRNVQELGEFHKYFAQRSVCTVQTSLGSDLVGFHKVCEVSEIVSSPTIFAHSLQI